MSEVTRAELRRLLAEATPGPWEAVEGASRDNWWVEQSSIRTVVSDPTGPDARYIAAANPQTVLDLIAAARTAETNDRLLAQESRQRHRVRRLLGGNRRGRLAELEAMRAKALDVLDEIAALPDDAVIDAGCGVVQPLRVALGAES